MNPKFSSDSNSGKLTEEISKSSSDLRTYKSMFQVISDYEGELSILLDVIYVLTVLKDTLMKEHFNKKNEQTRIRSITEINIDNIQRCKELTKFAIELRHLDEVIGNFSNNELEYCVPKELPIQNGQHSLENQSQHSNNIGYSNDKETVNHHYNHIFEILEQSRSCKTNGKGG
jgi:hypothetical protein